AVFVTHALDANDDSARQRSTPARMNGGECARNRIADQYWNAVRCLHAGQHALRIADNHVAIDRVAVLVLSRLRFFPRINDANVRAMHLPATSQGPLARKKLEKAAAILQNVLRSIVVEARETQRIARHFANAAETGGKAVHKTILLERFANKRADAVDVAPVETSCFHFTIVCDHFHWYRHYRSCTNSRSAVAHAALRRARLHAYGARVLRQSRRGVS